MSQSGNPDGFLTDYGPNTLQLQLRKTKNFLEETGVLEHAIDANPEANKRFIVRNGKLVALPTGLGFSQGVSFYLSETPRLLLEPFLSRGKDSDNESVADFMSRRLGKEALEYLAKLNLPEFTRQNPKLFACVIPSPPFMTSNKVIAPFFWGVILVKNGETSTKSTCLLPSKGIGIIG